MNFKEMKRSTASVKGGVTSKKWFLWCRLCANNTSQNRIDVIYHNKEPIILKNNRELQLSKAIERYFAVKITAQDPLPKILCTTCFNLIIAVANFGERILKVQKMFCDLMHDCNSTESCDLRSLLRLDVSNKQVLSQPALAEMNNKLKHIEESVKTKNNQIIDNPLCDVDIKEEIMDASSGDRQVDSKATADELHEEAVLEEGKDSDSPNEEEDDPFSNVGLDKDYNIDEIIFNEEASTIQRLKNSLQTHSKEREVSLMTKSHKMYKKCKKNKSSYNNNKSCDLMLSIPCTECGEQYESFQFYCEHLKCAHNHDETAKEWKCPLCKKVLSSVHRLQQHLRTHASREAKMLPCSECGMKFPTNGRLNAHIKIKHSSKLYMCEECGLSLSTSSNLKFHMLTHTDVAPLECEICKKRFKYARRLKIHMETHDSQKHICNICGLQLNTRITLRGHMLVHNDVMKYKCDSCGRSFRQKKTLKYHLISHTGLKPYTCDFCDRAFTNGANCRLHKQKVHPEEWAALEAAGRTKNIVQQLPNMETLKTLTKSAGSVNPIPYKQGPICRGMNNLKNVNATEKELAKQ